MPEEKVSPQSHIYVDLDESQTGPRPSDTCGEPANNWDKPAADAGPRQPRTYRIVDKSIAGSDERTQFLQSPPVPQEAAPRCPFGYTKEQPGTKHECAIHKFSDYAATAPDWAMRRVREYRNTFGTGANPRWTDEMVADLIRQAGSERERRLTSVLFVIMSDMPKKRDWLDPDIEREASRLLGGESK